jgi:tubby-related protein 1
MGRNNHDKNSESVLGKLRSNFLGTEYHIYDHGKNPEFDDSHYDEKNNGEITGPSAIRCELGAILYAASTSLGAKGPRKMKMCISMVDDEGNPLKVWQPMKKEDESIATCLKKETSSIDKLVLLENKSPSWSNDVKAYVLNFNGRVTMASVKNFQLCTHDGKQIMQFGRVGDDEFNLDMQWPMSLFQAFSVALSSFDSKLGCD